MSFCKYCKQEGLVLEDTRLVCKKCSSINGFRFGEEDETEDEEEVNPREEEGDEEYIFPFWTELAHKVNFTSSSSEALREPASSSSGDLPFPDVLLSSDKTRRQVHMAEEGIQEILQNSPLFSGLDPKVLSSLVSRACLIFGNCTRVWSSSRSDKPRSFQLPKDISVRLCASFIYSVQCCPYCSLTFTPQDIINEFSRILPLQKAEKHKPDLFQSSVYKFIGTMQEYRLFDIQSPETQGNFSVCSVYENYIRIFCRLPEVQFPIYIEERLLGFFDTMQYHQWIDGKGPKMSACVAIYHCILEGCPEFASLFPTKEDFLAFQRPYLEEKEKFTKLLICFFLVDLKKHKKTDLLEWHEKTLLEKLTCIKNYHKCM